MSRQATEQGHDPRPAPAAAPERFETVIVGGGQAGLAVGYHLSRTHRTWLSGPDTGHLPVRTGSRWDRLLTPPAHHRGVVGSQPGLYFLGLWFLSAFTSSLLGGVGSDAEHIAEQIAPADPTAGRRRRS
jgi:hypothetical protein